MNFDLKTYADEIGITLKIQSYLLNSKFTYLILPGMGRMETMICTTLEMSSGRKLVIVILATVKKVKYK